jgi:hypothetical protein
MTSRIKMTSRMVPSDMADLGELLAMVATSQCKAGSALIAVQMPQSPVSASGTALLFARAGMRAIGRRESRIATPGASSSLDRRAILAPAALRRQLAAFRFTPFRKATDDNFLSAAFSSLRLVVRKRTTSSCPSSSAHAINVP